MPIGIIPMLRPLPRLLAGRTRPCCFNAYRHYPYVETAGRPCGSRACSRVSMPIGIIPMLRPNRADLLVVMIVAVSMPIGIIPMLRRRRGVAAGRRLLWLVSMPIGIIPMLRPAGGATHDENCIVSMPIGIIPMLRRHAYSAQPLPPKFQCLSARVGFNIIFCPRRAVWRAKRAHRCLPHRQIGCGVAAPCRSGCPMRR